MTVGATNGPYRGQKGDMYDGGIRVPACAMWPGRIQAGSETDQVVLLMDLFPTACEAAGADFDHAIEGQSILPTLLGHRQDLDDRVLYWVRREGGSDFFGLTQQAVRKGDLKLLQNRPGSPLQLFDLSEDPYESNDCIANQDERHTMTTILRTEIQKSGVVPWQKLDGSV